MSMPPMYIVLDNQKRDSLNVEVPALQHGCNDVCSLSTKMDRYHLTHTTVLMDSTFLTPSITGQVKEIMVKLR